VAGIVITALIVLLPIVWSVVQYNNLVSLRNYIASSWANVDTELQRRYDLIPNLVATVQGYAAHERSVLEHLADMRRRCLANQGSPDEQARDETQLVEALHQVLVVIERYPDLKAAQSFLELNRELVDTEDRIQTARRFYNGNVRDYRNACETFPSSFVASVFGFKPREYFTVPSAIREVPSASTAA
jgi:LemA protein